LFIFQFVFNIKRELVGCLSCTDFKSEQSDSGLAKISFPWLVKMEICSLISR